MSTSDNPRSATVPMSLEGGLPAIDVSVGEVVFSAAFDTGGILSLSPRLASRLSLPNLGEERIEGAGGGGVPGYWTQIPEVIIGALSLRKCRALAYGDPDAEESVSLGGELFRAFAVRIDYDRKFLTLAEHPSRLRSSFSVPVSFHGDLPTIEIAVDGVRGRFMVDTGSTRPLLLSKIFAARTPAHSGTTERTVLAHSVGGPIWGRAARAQRVDLGDSVIHDPIILLADQEVGILADPALDGILGFGLLRRFVPTLDYAASALWLRQGRAFHVRDVWDRAGMTLGESNGSIIVEHTVTGGPADEAGIQAGEQILQIDGRLLTAKDDLRAPFLREPGTRVALALPGARQATVVLRDLL